MLKKWRRRTGLEEATAPPSDRLRDAPHRSPPQETSRPTEGRICICTPDYVYLVKNGGIGTAFHHLALVLAGRGFEVTIIYASEIGHVSQAEREAAAAAVEQEGCRLEFLFDDASNSLERALYPNDIYTVGSYLAYKQLAQRDFDTVIFADWRGLAYYSVHAKRQGLAFARTQLWVQGHSSTLWHDLNNQADRYDQLEIRAFHFERRSIELCDKFVPASAYLAEWNLAHGFIHPSDTEVLPLVINETLLPGTPPASNAEASSRSLNEIVFFGRLEPRKGLQVFLQAIQRLFSRHADVVAQNRLTFTFMGKITQIQGMSSIDYIEQHLVDLPVRYSVLVSLSSQEAIRYLANRPALAVIASLADNSPMTIHECIYAKVPFIASNIGGIAEIIHPDDQDVLFKPLPSCLADSIISALQRSPKPVRAQVNQLDDNIPRWLDLLRARPGQATAPAVDGPTPRVSVCITHYERARFLGQTLKGLEAQTYKDFEILIIDNGSTSADAVEFLETMSERHPTLSIRRFDLPDLYPGAARNRAISEAEGEYVLIMDDDNYAHPRQIELFLKAAMSSGFDALTCAAVLFPEDIDCPDAQAEFFYMYLPTGSGVSLNLFNNLYGDANGFFRRSALQAVGGYTEERSSWEDYELYAALELAGYKTAVVPEPLMYLRHTTGSVSRTGGMLGNYYRALRPALAHFPWRTFGDALLVSLNETLRSVASANYGQTVETSDGRIARESNDPVVVNRLLVRRAVQGGRLVDGIEQLKAIVDTSSHAEVLGWDLYLLSAASNRLDLWRSSRATADVKAIVSAYAEGIKQNRFGPLISLLDGMGRSEPDFLYLKGLAQLLEGSPIAAFFTWAHMLDVPDAFYLQRNKDVVSTIENKFYRRGYGHYLRHGFAEGRPFSYAAPIKSPFAQIGTKPDGDYLNEFSKLYGDTLWDAKARLSALLLRLIASGSVIEIADLAEHVLDLAETRYLDVNDDVRLAMNDGSWTSDGLEHWLLEGNKESRTHLIGSLPAYAIAAGQIIPASELAATALRRAPISASPLAKWLQVAG